MNPWEEIDLETYERHMSLKSVYQLQTMNEMMKAQFYSYSVSSVMILGAAGGNGFEHIDKNRFEKVYAVDINQSYLEICKKRYGALQNILETICADLSQLSVELPHAELLIANLLVEYIGYEHFQNVILQVKPKYLSVVIQVNTDDTFVSESPYIHEFDNLERVHHQMEEEPLISKINEIGYVLNQQAEIELSNGKKLVRMDFKF